MWREKHLKMSEIKKAVAFMQATIAEPDYVV